MNRLSSRPKRSSTDSYCFKQTCEEMNFCENHSTIKCYNKQVCGVVCRETLGKRGQDTVSSKPGYFKRIFYTRKYCSKTQCINYRFDCGLCPDPQQFNFSIFRINNGCVDCYYSLNM